MRTAISQIQYQVIKLVNNEQLILYYGIGNYISHNFRNGYWRSGAILFISHMLQMELSSLREFSERNLKTMRTFYEEWQSLDANSAIVTDKFQRLPIVFFNWSYSPYSNPIIGKDYGAIFFLK